MASASLAATVETTWSSRSVLSSSHDANGSFSLGFFAARNNNRLWLVLVLAVLLMLLLLLLLCVLPLLKLPVLLTRSMVVSSSSLAALTNRTEPNLTVCGFLRGFLVGSENERNEPNERESRMDVRYN